MNHKFTVIITHYNQMRFIKTAILSILNQTYPNVELIIADDCSSDFNCDIVENVIKKYNHHKYHYKILSSKKNVGTVKNLNRALKKATGEYILFFAADDKMLNNHVIENFVLAFKDSRKNIITTQCCLYDNKLKNKIGNYVDLKTAKKMNQLSSHEIYEKMCEGCFYGSGGTAYRASIFKKYGFFNENYLLVEDWSYWLYVLRNGEKIYYENFTSLCHRDGGISHSEYTKSTIPNHIKQYYRDILNIYVYEVLPYISQFTVREQYRILRQFNETILYYARFVPELTSYLHFFDEKRLSNTCLKYYWKLQTLWHFINPNVFKKIFNLVKCNKVVPITFIAWLLCCIFVINQIIFKSNLTLFLAYIISYIIIYYFIYAIDQVSNYLILKKKREI